MQVEAVCGEDAPVRQQIACFLTQIALHGFDQSHGFSCRGSACGHRMIRSFRSPAGMAARPDLEWRMWQGAGKTKVFTILHPFASSLQMHHPYLSLLL
ncbi:hypothetical protein SCFA_20052 [anaerobic digester metagenome]|uniref:Uncharacterized protein n=1 Tax=anaerobic digester metagenome TaxID=1263854 RepID=A0A485LYT1_9ZZZZ